MLTFRPTAFGPSVVLVVLSSLLLYIPDSHAQSQLPACAAPCAASAAATAGCSLTDSVCICSSNPFIGAYTPCVEQNCLNADIQAALSFYTSACASAPVSSTIAASSSTTGLATSSVSSSILTFPSSVLPTTTTSSLSTTTTTTTSTSTTTATTSTTSSTTSTGTMTTTTGTSTTSTPRTAASTQTISSKNAAASLSADAHAAAALIAGGIGALIVAVAV